MNVEQSQDFTLPPDPIDESELARQNTTAVENQQDQLQAEKYDAKNSEDELTSKDATPTEPAQPKQETKITYRERTGKTPEELAKIAAVVSPKLISNNVLLFVCLLLLVIVIFMRNYGGMTKPKTKIDQISEERLKSLNGVSLPDEKSSYEKTVSSMVAKEFNLGTNFKEESNREDMYDIVKTGSQVFKFAKERPAPKPKNHAPMKDPHTLGLETMTDGYQ